MKKSLVWPVLLIVVLALSRWPGLMPHNFSAVYAIVFCAGLYLPGRLGWIVPLAVAAGSDLLLNVLFYAKDGFSVESFLVAEIPTCLAYAGMVGLGRLVGPKKSWWMLVGGGLIGALLFYIVTNTASWLTLAEYPKTLAGWVQAITVGLPKYPQTWEFFRGTFLSGGIFTALFVGAMKLTEVSEDTEEEESAPVPEMEGEPAEAELDR